MKFKSIFALFNIVVGVSFIFVFAMPFFALGSEYALSFWKGNWPLALLLIVVLIGIDIFFALNWRLFALLEREDWPALTHYLEERIIGKGQWSPRLVHLLANTYLVLSDPAAVESLESKVRQAKPSLLERNALVFGLAHILSNNHEKAKEFFLARLQRKKQGDWLQWYYVFSLLLLHDFSSAADTIENLAVDAKDALVTALCYSFLKDTLAHALPERTDTLIRLAKTARERVLARFPTRESFEKEIQRAGADIHVVVLSKSIHEAADSLYSPE
ncbi:hypothetical protein MASR2M78_03040 [Treponema sp.]